MTRQEEVTWALEQGLLYFHQTPDGGLYGVVERDLSWWVQDVSGYMEAWGKADTLDAARAEVDKHVQ